MEDKCLNKKKALIDLIYNNNNVFGYKGGTFSSSDIKEALKKNIPLTLDFSIPGKCLNNCNYCGYYQVNKEGKLHQSEVLSIFKEFKNLGGKSIKILGEGEPLLRHDIFELLYFIQEMEMIPVLFTCGDVIGDHHLSQKIHNLSGEQITKKLYSLGCTVVLKYDSLDQDSITQRNGYSKIRDNALNILMNSGFNSSFPSRLAFGIVLLKENIEEMQQIFIFAIRNNIYPLICPLMPIGKMKDKAERDKYCPPKSQIHQLRNELIKIRKKFGIHNSELSDFPGGLPCDISRAGLYVDDAGKVFICEADDFVENIRKKSLKELWKKINIIKWEKYGDKRRLGLCFPKRREGII